MSVLDALTAVADTTLYSGSLLYEQLRQSKTAKKLKQRKTAVRGFVARDVTPFLADVKDLYRNDLKPLLADVKDIIVDRLSPRPEPPKPVLPARADLPARIATAMTDLDARYQNWMQTHFDPLLGRQRHQQLQALGNEEYLALTPGERSANRQMAIGAVTTGLATVSKLSAPACMPLVGALALVGLWHGFASDLGPWWKTRRIGGLHLVMIFMSFLFLGGNTLLGTVALLLGGLGLKIKALSEKESRSNLINVFKLQPPAVWVRSNGVEMEIPFGQLQVGDTLVLHAGQVVPVDGTILTGMATVDQRALTGEAQPAEKSVGDEVMAATLVVSGKMDVRVERTGNATTAGQIGEILNRTAQSKLSMQLSILDSVDRLALPTLVTSVAIMPLAGVTRAVNLLGANYTTATFMTAPMLMLKFLNKAAHQGILLKDIIGLERISQVDTVVFDKTGTLTLDQPQVGQIHRFHEQSETEILTLAAAAEARQTHPIARAIETAAAERQLTLPAIDQAHYEVGYGLKVWLRKSERSDQPTLVRVGSGRFMTMEGITLPDEVEVLIDDCQAQGHSLVLVALADQVIGGIELQPSMRPEAPAIIAGLRHRGLALFILSGDQETPTRTLAQTLGMTGYFANTLPEEKAQLIAQLQAEGRRVCFVGDGINDALAMRQAEVSISLRGATTVATDTAQIVLMDGDLTQLVALFDLAQQFSRNLNLNFRTTVTTSLLAVAGIFTVPLSLAAVEFLFIATLLTCLGISVKPLWEPETQSEPRQESPISHEQTNGKGELTGYARD
jgi:Cu2+-exporting ATPase